MLAAEKECELVLSTVVSNFFSFFSLYSSLYMRKVLLNFETVGSDIIVCKAYPHRLSYSILELDDSGVFWKSLYLKLKS